VRSKNDLLGEIVEGCLVAGFFMMTVHVPLHFSVHECLAKKKSPVHSFAPHQVKCFATCFLFPELKIAFSGVNHDSCNCKMHFAKFQTVYIMQCLEQEHYHQACCMQSTAD